MAFRPAKLQNIPKQKTLINKFKEKLVRFYEMDDSRDLKRFFHSTSLQLNTDNMIVKNTRLPILDN